MALASCPTIILSGLIEIAKKVFLQFLMSEHLYKWDDSLQRIYSRIYLVLLCFDVDF